MRLVGFVSRMLVGIVIGFVLGMLFAEGKLHIPHAKAAEWNVNIDPITFQQPDWDGNYHASVVVPDTATNPQICFETPNSGTTLYACSALSPGLNDDLTLAGSDVSPTDLAAIGLYRVCVFDADASPDWFDPGFYPAGCGDSGSYQVLAAEATTSTTTATTTPPGVDKNYLFLGGVIIFLLAFPVWARVFKV